MIDILQVQQQRQADSQLQQCWPSSVGEGQFLSAGRALAAVVLRTLVAWRNLAGVAGRNLVWY